MRPLVLAAVAAVAAALPLAAAAQPAWPSRDFAATYRVTSGGEAAELSLFYNAALKGQRIELSPAGAGSARQGATGLAQFSNEAAELVLALLSAAAPDRPIFAHPPDTTLDRTGTATVAGHRCTVFRAVRSGTAAGTLCLTEDGILLSGDLAAGGRRGRVEAIALRLAPQPAALFEPPQGGIELPLGEPPAQNASQGAPQGPAQERARPQR